MLIERRQITEEDLERALELQKERGDKLGKILVDLGFIAMRDVLAALSDQLGVPLVTPDGPPPAAPEIDGLTARFLRQCRFYPIAMDDSTLTIAMADPLDFETISAVRGFCGLKVRTALAAEQEVLDAIEKHYGEAEKRPFDGDVESAQGAEDLEHLLDRSAGDFYDLRRLGFDDRMLARMEHFTSLPHGIFLVTGPTGSGKSTTLYSALKRINLPDKKIITIEDPVEYQMDGINQIHVNPAIGLTFAAGLRHIVRQDPDVIMVGEIRDRETADIAIRAALTGHLVFSTLHTNDAPSAITRLTDMGVENYLITSSLVSVLAQRLVRLICPHCKAPAGVRTAPDGEKMEAFRGAGCESCSGTGYTSRVGIFELMELNEEIRKLIMANADAADITALARRNGMRNLREDGWLKVAGGVTTADEVMRVTQEF